MILSLFLTLDCNFNCRYCYAAPHSKNYMNLTTATKAVELATNHTKKNGETIFGLRFFGGEPLMNWKLIPCIVDFCKNGNFLSGLEIAYGIATNGSLLTPEKCDFFSEHDFGVGISIDGPELINDNNRKTIGGHGTYRRVLKKIEMARQRDLRVSLALVADPSTISELSQSIRYLHEQTGCSFFTISFNIHVTWNDDQLSQLRDAYLNIARYYAEMFNSGKPVQIDFLNNKINVLLRGGFIRDSLCDIGRTDLAVTPDGLIYPCLRLAAMDPEGTTSIGSLEDGIDENKLTSLKVTCDARYLPESRPARCTPCLHSNSCLNWCAATNLAMTGHPAHVGDVMCSHEMASVAAAQYVIENIRKDHYVQLYQDYLSSELPKVILPSVPHGEHYIPHFGGNFPTR